MSTKQIVKFEPDLIRYNGNGKPMLYLQLTRDRMENYMQYYCFRNYYPTHYRGVASNLTKIVSHILKLKDKIYTWKYQTGKNVVEDTI